jgi:hypothetical protein
MNILYIGPYKDIEYKQICHNHIFSLKNKYNLRTLPIYLSNNQVEIDENILYLEEKTKTQSANYIAVIQYAPAEYLFPFDKSIAKKSICIPIIKYPILYSDKNKNINSFDQILCDSKYDAELIKKNLTNKSKKIKLFSYKVFEKISAQKINLNYLNNEYKFYIFINDDNVGYVNNIILGFSTALSSIKNCCLLIISSNKQISQKISRYVDIVSQKIMYIKNHIKIVEQPYFDKDNTFDLSIHNSCDCLIDIRYSSNCGFSSFLAKDFNNSIISNENININYESCYIDNEQIYFDLQAIIQQKDISEKIKNTVRTKPIYQQNNIPTLDQVI